MSDPFYFIAEDGVRWRVHDTAFGPPLAERHRHRRLPLGDRRAIYRVFVAADGQRRAYAFPRNAPPEDRTLDAERLAQQFAQSGWMASARFDPSRHGAGVASHCRASLFPHPAAVT